MIIVINVVFEHGARFVEFLNTCISLEINLFEWNWLISDQYGCLVEEICAHWVFNDIIELSWRQEHRQHISGRILVVHHLHLAKIVTVDKMRISKV